MSESSEIKILKAGAWECTVILSVFIKTISNKHRWEVFNPLFRLSEDKGLLLKAVSADGNLYGMMAALSWNAIRNRDRRFESRELTDALEHVSGSGLEDDTVLIPCLLTRHQENVDVTDALLSRVTGKERRHPLAVLLWDEGTNSSLEERGFSLQSANDAILKGIAQLARGTDRKEQFKACITGRKCKWKDVVGCTFAEDTLPCLRLPESGKFSHADLVDLAMRWLDAKKFKVIISEPGYRREQPDAVGFKDGGFSCLVECKASRSDFLRDKDKPFRKDPATGIGTMRVYLTAPGVCTPNELPEGWQLIEALDLDTLVLKHGAKGCLEMNKDFIFHKKLWQAEWDLLYSWAYRKLISCLKPVPRTGRSLKIIEENV